MNPIERTVLDLAQQSLENREPEDYFDEEGFLLCGQCHTRKQYDAVFFNRNLDRNQVMDDLMGYELLVLDDLGAERNTPYAMEQVYCVIDSRQRSGKPTVFTTSLSLEELKNPASQAQARIYDRVLRMCPYRFFLCYGGRVLPRGRGGNVLLS